MDYTGEVHVLILLSSRLVITLVLLKLDLRAGGGGSNILCWIGGTAELNECDDRLLMP